MRPQLRRTPHAPRRARTLVDEAFATAGASEETRAIAQLLVSELVTNAVRHGGGDTIGLEVRCGSLFHVGVRDAGTSLPVLRDRSGTRTTGRGLFLVRSLAHAWGIEENAQGKVVWFSLPRDERVTTKRAV